MKKFSLFSLVLVLFTCTAANAADQTTSLTIYGNSPQSWEVVSYSPVRDVQGYAVVNFARQASFAEGLNMVQVGDVPDEIDPSSIMIKNRNRNLQAVEQNFIAAPSAADVIKRSIGRQVEVEKFSGDGVISTKGILLDSANGLVVKDGDKIKVINDYSSVAIDGADSAASGNMIKWLINSAGANDSLFEYSYKTDGISWSASYDIYLDGAGNEVMAKIEGWANLLNNTKMNIRDTNLKLVAGETAQDNQPRAVPMMAMAKGVAMDMAEAAPSMQQQKFSEYHMYTIDRKINLPAQSSKKIKLFSDKEGVLAGKKYVFDGGISSSDSVKSVITFANDDKSRLGVALPGGKYRVFMKDSSGGFEQVGEATQSHKAEGEKIELTIGNSYDLKATRNQADSEQDQLRHRGKYTVTVEIQNALDEKTDVFVKEPVNQQNWAIISKTHDFRKVNSNLIEFTVPVEAKSKATLEYVVQYSW